MTKTSEKKELVTRERTQPETYFGEIESYIDRLFRHPFAMLTPSFLSHDYPELENLSPSVDVYEEGDHLVIKAELPGMKKEDLDVTVAENRVTISGEKKKEEKVERKDYHWSERSYGSFRRSFRLPENVKGDAADASFKNGILEIRIPKSGEEKRKKLTVK
jgi:HSP20 family protein